MQQLTNISGENIKDMTTLFGMDAVTRFVSDVLIQFLFMCPEIAENKAIHSFIAQMNQMEL